MLSDADVIAKVATGDIQVLYAFVPNDDGAIKASDPPRRADRGPGKPLFRSRLVRSRLALTLGPLVKPVSHARWVSWSHRFSGHSGIVDLRKCPNGWALLPGQSAVVFTNERLELPPAVGALIVGRVSNYNNGLVLTTSFLDSGWQGLVKLHLINTSRRSVRLTLGMEVARLFFEETPAATPDTRSVAEQGSHYGSTWSHILSDGADPFPQRPEPRARGLGAAMSKANDFLQRYAGFGFLALVIALGGFGVTAYTSVQNAVAGAQEAEKLTSTVNELKLSAMQHGVAELSIAAGQADASIEVELPAHTDHRSGSSTVLGFLEDHGTGATIEGFSAADADGSVTLTLQYSLPAPASQTERVRVLWVYLP